MDPTSTSQQQQQQPSFIPFESTSALLINLNQGLLDRMNARDYESPFFDVLDTDCHIELHGVFLEGRSGFIEGYRRVADESPGLRVEVTNSSALVDEPTAKGTVILNLMIRGFSEDLNRAATLLSGWKREGEKWTCYSYIMFYGIQQFP